ncbi:MAG: hypothetical protein COB49_10135 [Alphaproteobacteria bacterium]|nr:MAG: hypothetical protein COB49_10135 [Alphaproteobacteria bacterium]
MPFILILVGFIFLLYVISRFMQQSKSGKLNRMLRYGFAIILGLLAFLILVRGNVAVSGILGLLSFMSAQGGLWKFFTGSNSATPTNATLNGTAMTRDEALDILGLSGNPDPAEIKDAHHKMMLKLHPDQGGSDYFASKLNQARDILL